MGTRPQRGHVPEPGLRAPEGQLCRLHSPCTVTTTPNSKTVHHPRENSVPTDSHPSSLRQPSVVLSTWVSPPGRGTSVGGTRGRHGLWLLLHRRVLQVRPCRSASAPQHPHGGALPPLWDRGLVVLRPDKWRPPPRAGAGTAAGKLRPCQEAAEVPTTLTSVGTATGVHSTR